MQATPASLRRIFCIDVDYQANGTCCPLADQTSKNPEARVKQRSIRATLSRNSATGLIERSLRAARHRAYSKRFKRDDVGRGDDGLSRLVQRVESRVRLALFRSREAPHGCDALGIVPIDATPVRILFDNGGKAAGVTADYAPVTISERRLRTRSPSLVAASTCMPRSIPRTFPVAGRAWGSRLHSKTAHQRPFFSSTNARPKGDLAAPA